MDEKKNVRVFSQDSETFMLTQTSTLEINSKDMLNIKYADFDDFAITSSILQWKSTMMFVHETKPADDYTWKEQDVMLDNHKYVAGPKKASGTGMIFYLQKYKSIVVTDKKGKQPAIKPSLLD